MVRKGKYPWLARIGFGTLIKGKFIFLCGGTLITKDFVLTASHCFREANTNIVVRLGETHSSCTKSPCDDPVIQDFEVKKLIMHKQFDTTNGFADIALLHLKTPAKLNKWVRTICLSKQIKSTIGDDGITAGWGFEDSKTRERPEGLKELTMKIVHADACLKYFPKLNFQSYNYICIGGKKNEDTCGGDSGGPFMKILNLGDLPRMYAVGVLSFGSKNCGQGVPSIFTSVNYYMDWIIDNINLAQKYNITVKKHIT
ncbi:hypothetical protein WA026_002981 [Henosepilachna vigintioctopunctata]